MNGQSSKKIGSRPATGFSLIETIVGTLVLALSVVGSFEVLRLSDLKAKHARIDNRITELLRENSDYVMYVAYDLLPANGAVLSQGSLYQFYDSRHNLGKASTPTPSLQTFRH